MTKRRIIQVALGIVLAGAAAVWLGQRPALAGPSDCKAVVVIYARGSGQPLAAAEARQFEAEIKAATGHHPAVGFVELGPAMPGVRGDYPAVGVDARPHGDVRVWAPQAANVLDARLHLSWLGIGNYDNSVAQGKALLFEFLAAPANRSFLCADSKIVLAGYSQGAQVIGQALADRRIKRYQPAILSVQLFGDPQLEYRQQRQPLEIGRWYRGPSSAEAGGILGRRWPYVEPTWSGRVASWCRDHDGICTSQLSFGEHSHYGQRELGLAADEAGQLINAHLVKRGLEPPTACRPHKLDIVLLLDMTPAVRSGDFFSLEAARLEAGRLLKNGCSVRIAAVGFFDHAAGRATRLLSDFTDNGEELAQRIFSYRGSDVDLSLRRSQFRQGLLAAAAMGWRADADKAVIAQVQSQDEGWQAALTTAEPTRAYLDEPLTRQVIRRYAELAIDFRYNLDDYRAEPRPYAGDELTALRTIGEALGGRLVSKGCAFNCYWRLDGSFAVKPVIYPQPVAALVGQPQRLSVGYPAGGRIEAAGRNVTYEWDLDCDGWFERSTGANLLDSWTNFTQPQDCSGFVRARTVLAFGEDYAIRDSFTAPLPVRVRQSVVTAQPRLNQLLAKAGDGWVEFSWRPVDPVAAYRLTTGDGQFLALTNATELRLDDVPPGRAVALSVTPLSSDGQAGQASEVTGRSRPNHPEPASPRRPETNVQLAMVTAKPSVLPARLQPTEPDVLLIWPQALDVGRALARTDPAASWAWLIVAAGLFATIGLWKRRHKPRPTNRHEQP